MIRNSSLILLGVLLSWSFPNLSDASYSSPTDTHTHTSTIELKPASLLGSYKTAAVCFLGVGDCVSGNFGKGDGDMSVDTAKQCQNEGFIKLNCNSVQQIDGVCPYNSAYGTKCICHANLLSCPAGQVGIGDSCNGKYRSCQCSPSLISCASNQNGQGASCGGKYQSCVCKSEYQYSSSNCSSPRSVSGSSCGGKYTGCTCPTGVSTGAYGCKEYYPAPCGSICKIAKSDNCDNRNSVSTPYGCMTYFSDCSSKCQTGYPDNCRNRTAVTAPYGCKQYFADCSSKCQVANTETCDSQIAENKPNAVIIKNGSDFSSYSMSGKELILMGNISTSGSNVYIGNNTKIYSAGDIGSKCTAATLNINGNLQLNGNAEINIPATTSALSVGNGTLTLNKDMVVNAAVTVPAGSTGGIAASSSKFTANDITISGTLNLAANSYITNKVTLNQGSVFNILGKSHQIRQVTLQNKSSGSITKWNVSNANVNLNYDNSVDDGFDGDTTNAGFQLTATNSTINANGSFSYDPPDSGNSKYNLVNSTIARVNYFIVRGKGLIVTFSQNSTVSFFNRYGDGSNSGAVGITPGYSTATSNFNESVFYFFSKPSDWVGRGSVQQSNLTIK